MISNIYTSTYTFSTDKQSQNQKNVDAPKFNVSSAEGGDQFKVGSMYQSSAVSSGVAQVLLQQQEVVGVTHSPVVVNTNQGDIHMDFTEYFSPPSGEWVDISNVPLLSPSAQNIEALTDFISSNLEKLLREYGITAPENVSYDGEGNMILPENYPFKDELESLLAENPTIERALNTVNALSSHYAEIQKLQPFHDELSQVKTEAEMQALLERFSYLFSQNRSYSDIGLSFSSKGMMTVQVDGNPIKLA